MDAFGGANLPFLQHSRPLYQKNVPYYTTCCSFVPSKQKNQIMPIFNWNAIIPNIPANWRQTEGKGVRIAFLDSGANLSAPALKHLDQPGHKFNVAQPGFNVQQAISSGGNDDVTDQLSFGEYHGTACLSALAGKPENDTTGIKGVAPQAEVFIFRIMDAGAMYRKGYILDAIEIALSKNVDIIVCSVLPSFNGTYTDGRRDVLYSKIKQSNVALVTTVTNTTLLSDLTTMRFPSNHPVSIVGGVAQMPILSPKPDASVLLKDISFITSPVKVTSLKNQASDAYPSGPCSSSLATAALAGVIALGMSQLQQRPERSVLISALQTALGCPYDPTAMMNQTTPGFYSKA